MKLTFIGLIAFFALLAATIDHSAGRYTNRKGKQTLVLSAPSKWDEHYKQKFFDIIKFQIQFAKMILKKDNVVVLADKHTMPYLDGRSTKIKEKLPKDVLLQADIYDIHIRDFAPLGLRRTVKFGFSPRNMAPMAARQMDKSMRRFLDRHDLKMDKEEPDLLLGGADVVDNGVDKAVIATEVLDDNKGRLPDWAASIKMLHAFKNVAMVPTPANSSFINANTTTTLDDAMAFIDEKHLVISELEETDMKTIDSAIWKKFRKRVMIVNLPTHYTPSEWKGHTGTCGVYSSLLSTKRFIYLPVYGNDMANWKDGHSQMTDKMVTDVIRVNAGPLKTVVPINVPKSICDAGIGLRSLTWQTDGELADKMINLARFHGRRRLRV